MASNRSRSDHPDHAGRSGQPVLVLGGTGKTGSREARGLPACGQPLRIGARSAAQPLDCNDRTTWTAAIALPAGRIPEPSVDVGDSADVSVAA